METKALFTGGATLRLAQHTSVSGSIALGAGDNSGIAHYGIGTEFTLIDAVRFRLRAQVNHDQWSSWRAGENRAAAMVRAEPLHELELGIGFAYRVPVLDPAGYCSPFRWPSAAREWNFLYRVQWSFLSRPNGALAVWIANSDRLTIHTAQQFPFGLNGTLKIAGPWRLTAQLGSDIKGLSGLLLSLGELDLRTGMKYGF